MKNLLLLWLLLSCLVASAQCPSGNTFTVTNNSGGNILGSLARACQCVNSTPALTTIVFAIPSGSTVIQPTSDLLISATGILVDGTTQNGIIIDGGIAAPPAQGLHLTGTGNTVQGLTIRNFTATFGGHGIRVDGNNNTITRNTIHNNRNGVFTSTPVTVVEVSENSMYCNSAAGISLANAPMPPTVVANTQRVKGTATANSLVEVFTHSTTGCPLALCQGKTLVGTATANAAGDWQLNLITGQLTSGQSVTITRTVNGNNTSEFTGCTTVLDCSAFDVNVTETDVSCFGGSNGTASATVTGASPVAAVTYLWSKEDITTANLTNLVANSYTVTATDAAGCTAIETTTVAQPPMLTNMLTRQNISCFGGSNGSLTAVPGGGTPNYSYIWNTGPTTASINNLGPGTYSVTVMDNNGCTTSSNALMTAPTQLTSSLTVQNVSCFGALNGSVTALVGGGTPTYSYLWNTGQNTASINNLNAAAYAVTVTDNNGCTSTGSTQVMQPTELTLAASANNETSAGANDGSASAVPGGGSPNYSYLWSNGGMTAQVGNLAPGTYTVTITDMNGCTKSATATVASGPGVGGPCKALPVYAVLVPSQVCGNSTLSLEVDDLFPHPSVKYWWYFPNGDSTVTVLPTLDLLVTSTDFSGEYFVVRDSAGCRSIPVGGAPVTVLSLDPTQVFAGNDTLICTAGVVVLKSQAPAQGTGAWVSLGSATIDNPASTMTAARNLQPGANAFIWQVSLGNCTAAASDTVTYFLEKKALLNDDRYTLQRAQDIAVMEVLLNDALAGLPDTVVTQLGSPSVGVLEYLEEGRRFRYTVDDDFRGSVQFKYVVCSPASSCNFPCDTATVTIDIQNLPLVPEGLVVNDPGANGRMTIKGINGFTRVEVAVFNRWGSQVFQENKYRNDAPWLGHYNGKALPKGAYYYYLKAWDGNTLIGGTQMGIIHLFEQD